MATATLLRSYLTTCLYYQDRVGTSTRLDFSGSGWFKQSCLYPTLMVLYGILIILVQLIVILIMLIAILQSILSIFLYLHCS